MKIITIYTILLLPLVVGYQNTSGHDSTEDNIAIVLDDKVVFVDEGVETLIKGHVSAYVTFKDSLTPKPIDLSIQMIKMKSDESDEVDFLFAHPREVELSNYETSLLEKYWTKLSSIYMNSQYKFIGDTNWTYGRRMAISFPFEIQPG